jgi:hypothetical protein
MAPIIAFTPQELDIIDQNIDLFFSESNYGRSREILKKMVGQNVFADDFRLFTGRDNAFMYEKINEKKIKFKIIVNFKLFSNERVFMPSVLNFVISDLPNDSMLPVLKNYAKLTMHLDDYSLDDINHDNKKPFIELGHSAIYFHKIKRFDFSNHYQKMLEFKRPSKKSKPITFKFDTKEIASLYYAESVELDIESNGPPARSYMSFYVTQLGNENILEMELPEPSSSEVQRQNIELISLRTQQAITAMRSLHRNDFFHGNLYLESFKLSGSGPDTVVFLDDLDHVESWENLVRYNQLFVGNYFNMEHHNSSDPKEMFFRMKTTSVLGKKNRLVIGEKILNVDLNTYLAGQYAIVEHLGDPLYSQFLPYFSEEKFTSNFKQKFDWKEVIPLREDFKEEIQVFEMMMQSLFKHYSGFCNQKDVKKRYEFFEKIKNKPDNNSAKLIKDWYKKFGVDEHEDETKIYDRNLDEYLSHVVSLGRKLVNSAKEPLNLTTQEVNSKEKQNKKTLKNIQKNEEPQSSIIIL